MQLQQNGQGLEYLYVLGNHICSKQLWVLTLLLLKHTKNCFNINYPTTIAYI
jgi:hypothetical protein